MSENNLSIEGYYKDFEHKGWHLGLMREALEKTEIPGDILKSIQGKGGIKFLVVGSATERNLDEIALLDKLIRPGKGRQDDVIILDYNNYPLQRGQDRAEFIEKWEENHKRNFPEDKSDSLLYPNFEFTQGDIRQLPLKQESTDIVITDYTLNFLADVEDIEKSFEEIGRILIPGGVVFISVKGNDKYQFSDDFISEKEAQDVQSRELSGGVLINQFPLHTYVAIAKKHGLKLVNYSLADNGTTLLCGILQKRRPE